MNINLSATNPEKWINKELDVRSNAILNPASNKWSTQRTPWIRMLSNAIIEGEDPDLRDFYALYSGNLDTFENSYHTTANDKFKFRPKPGITSAKIEFKGSLGSTKSTTVEFQCWTLDDLVILEKLYMVPGMSIILEWGWSMSTDGEKIGPLDRVATFPGPNKNYMNEIMKIILQYRKACSGNYDGLIGIVSNFSYQLNDNLGWDCSIELISPGEMWLEQNSTNVSSGCIENKNDKQKKQSNLEHKFHYFYSDCKNTQKLDDVNKITKTISVIQQDWEVETREYDKQLRTWAESIIPEALDQIDATRNSHEVYISWAQMVHTLNLNINLYQVTEGNKAQFVLDDAGSNPKLGLDLIPVTILPKFLSTDPRICTFKPKNIDPNTGKNRNADKARAEALDPIKEVVDNSKDKSAFSTTVDFILASGKTLINGAEYIIDQTLKSIGTPAEIRSIYPKDGLPDISDKKFAEDQIKIFGDTNDKKNLDSDENKKFSIGSTENVGLLNNVFINAGYLRDIVDSSEQHVSMHDFINKIITDLNDSTGGLWNLQIHIDEVDPSRIHIYDANYTSTTSRQNQVEPYKFALNSNDSNTVKLLLKDVLVQSKLVEGFKTMVLYGNDAIDNGNIDNANQGFNLYSNKVHDRYKDPKLKSTHVQKCFTPDGSTLDPDSNKTAADYKADIDEAYYLLLDAVDDESVSGAKNAVASYITYLNTKEPEVANTLPRNQNILLPFNFSLGIDGFSGFVWGNVIAFDYLPSRYQDNIYFQITKINHEITSEYWKTGLETVMRLRNNGKKDATGGIRADSKPGQIPNLDLPKEEKNTQTRTTFAAETTNGVSNSEKNLIEYQVSKGLSGGSDISQFFTSK